MRVAFITLYDNYCLGTRMLVSTVLRHGHQAVLITFKRFVNKRFYYNSPANMSELRGIMEDSGYLPVLEFFGDHDVMCPYPTPIEDIERDLLHARLEDFRPDMIALSLSSVFVPLARELTLDLRKRFPEARIMWGGIHCITDPEDGVGYADIICHSEADECLPALLADPGRREQPGFWFCLDGGVVKNPRAPLPQDLDSLPWPLHGDAEHEVMIEDGIARFCPVTGYADYTLMTQRGCPFHCTYCLHSQTREMWKGQRYLRRRSVDNVLDEVDYVRRRFGFEAVVFADDIFMISEEWIGEFCRKYRERFPGFPFGAYGHARFTSQKMLDDLARTGCWFTAIGIQSGSRYMTEEVYKRKDDPEQMTHFVGMVRQAGIENIVYDLLTNSSFEREEDCRATLDLLCRLPKPVKVAIKKIQTYPKSAYAALDLPDGGMSEELFRFYNLLYLLACQPGVDGRWVKSLVEDPELRSDTRMLEPLVGALARTTNRVSESEERVRHLQHRLRELETRVPHGVRHAARYLFVQLRKGLAGRLFPSASDRP